MPNEGGSEKQNNHSYSEKEIAAIDEVATHARSPFFYIKIPLIILKYTVYLLLIFLVVGYFYVMRPSYMQTLIKEQFEAQSTGTIDLKVKQASLFRGFIFEDVVIKSGKDFGELPVVKIKQLNVLYSIYGFWAGDFGLHEVGIYSPQIYLRESNGVWNVATLMKPGEPAEEKEEPEKEVEPSEPRTEPLSLPFSTRVFVKFLLEDFDLFVNGSGSSDPLSVSVRGFTFRTRFLTKEIDTIPVEPLKFLELIDTVLVEMNPQKKVDVRFSNDMAATKTGLNLHWLLGFDGHNEVPEFTSQLKIGDNNLPVTYKGRHRLPLNILLGYHLDYTPDNDRLAIKHFFLDFADDRWLNVSGDITQLREADKTRLDIKLDKSRIDLSKVYPLYRTVTEDRSMRFGGRLSLAPLNIKGGMNKLNIDGGLSMRAIYARLPGMTVRIPQFNLSYETVYNSSLEPFPIEYARAGWRGSLNNAKLYADLYYKPQQKVDVEVSVRNLNPSPFSGGQAVGNFNFGLNVSGRSLNHLKSTVMLEAPWFYYFLNRGKSGLNRLNFEVKTRIDSPDLTFKTVKVDVDRIYMALRNEARQTGIELSADNSLSMRGAAIDNTLNLKKLSLNIRKLHPTFPESIRESTGLLTGRLRNNIDLRGKTVAKIRGDRQYIRHHTRFFVYDYDIDDLLLEADVNLRPGFINIKQVALNGLSDALSLKVNGNLREGWVKTLAPDDPDKIVRVRGMRPDIKVDLFLGQKELKKVYQDNAISGSMTLKAHLKDQIAKGKFGIKDFYYSNSQNMRVNNVNLDFPFEHDLLKRKTLNLTAANKERIIKNYNFSEPFNFTIESVYMPLLDKPEPVKLIYPNEEYPGLAATMYYRDNVFEMPAMQINILNGIITARDIIFNVGRIKPEEMEYMARLQIKDIDLKQLMNKENAEAVSDGAIRSDILVAGNRLDQPVENVHGYVSIYKIGEEFGKQALKVVKPDSAGLVDFAVDNSIIVRKINLDLKEGLVYAKVIYRKALFGSIIGPRGEKIVQERIPITEFMQRATDEAEVYRRKPVEIGRQGEAAL